MTDLATQDYMAEVARRVRPAGAARLLLLVIICCFVALVAWAHLTALDQVTRGQGKVIPSGELQVVQNLEGGIISEILVQEGERVRAGQVILRLDRTVFTGDFNRLRQRYYAAQARIARLTGESALVRPAFPAETRDGAPEMVARQSALFEARWTQLQAELSVLQSRLLQRQQALAEARLNAANAERAVAVAHREFGLVEGIVKRGLEPEMHLIESEKGLVAAESERDIARLSLLRHQSALEEVKLEIAATRSRFQARSSEELAEARQEYTEVVEALPAHRDKLERTAILAPTDGIVNQVLVSTIGGVAQPGQPLIEIVPDDDRLLAEVAIEPSRIGFVYVGQPARVKLTAYDFTTYGSLKAQVTHISPDAIEDERGNARYLAHVRVVENDLTDEDGDPLPILPGMVAEVDILTGKRTILQYLLHPLAALKDDALRDR